MDEYTQLVSDCAQQGRNLMQMMANAGTIEPLYLYYRASNGKTPGKLLLIRDSVPVLEETGLKLATGEGLRSNVPYAGYFQWVWERARRCPILSYEGSDHA